jgi:L-fuculose-phosphate aldolase
MLNDIYNTPQSQIAYIGKVMFERSLTDFSGGNLSIREGNTIFISPTKAGHCWHWQLDPEEIVSGPIDTDDLTKHPAFSREGLSHLAIYRAFPGANAVIHAHPPHVLAFCALEKTLTPVLRACDQFGTLVYHDPAPEYSQEQADSIVKTLRPQEYRINDFAAAVLMPRHGIILAGKDIWSVMDSLERLNTDAYCQIAAGKLARNDPYRHIK